MIKISIFSIQKRKDSEFDNEIKNIIKMSSKLAMIQDINLFNNKIANAQKQSSEKSQEIYFQTYKQYMDNSFCIVLDEKGKKLNSYQFANLIESKIDMSFFIGGAYGFNSEIKQKADFILSLSDMTISHKIIKLMLFEQVYRGLCINSNHPYHK